jgi:DNA-binding MarR family transcriptional regulator
MVYEESAKFFRAEDEDQDLWLLFTHTRYAIFRARELELQRYGITPEQVSLLFVVQALGKEAKPAALSRQLLRQPHTVSAIVERMEKRGLVNKVRDLDRKNLIRVAITDKGHKAFEQSTKRGPIHRIMGELNQEEKKKFRQYLETIFAAARKEAGMDRDELPPSE